MQFPDEKVRLIGTLVYLLVGNVLHYVVRGNFKRITNGVDDVGGYVFIIGDLIISAFSRKCKFIFEKRVVFRHRAAVFFVISKKLKIVQKAGSKRADPQKDALETGGPAEISFLRGISFIPAKRDLMIQSHKAEKYL